MRKILAVYLLTPDHHASHNTTKGIHTPAAQIQSTNITFTIFLGKMSKILPFYCDPAKMLWWPKHHRNLKKQHC